MMLTLYQQTKIPIDTSIFIEHILCSYLEKPQRDGRSFYDEIYYAVLVIAHVDIRDYGNARYAMQALVKNAYKYAIKNNYSKADIHMLKKIIDLL